AAPPPLSPPAPGSTAAPPPAPSSGAQHFLSSRSSIGLSFLRLAPPGAELVHRRRDDVGQVDADRALALEIRGVVRIAREEGRAAKPRELVDDELDPALLLLVVRRAGGQRLDRRRVGRGEVRQRAGRLQGDLSTCGHAASRLVEKSKTACFRFLTCGRMWAPA